MFRFVLPLLLVPAAAAAQPQAASDEITLYRCSDADGGVAIQDFPCADGERQQLRTLQRPQDPPPAAAPPVQDATAAPAPALPPVEVIVRDAPRPMFECITPDGERYLSDRGDGNPRPAPLWFPAARSTPPGVPPGPRSAGERRAAGIASPGMSTSPGPSLTTPSTARGASPPPPPPRHRPGHGPWRGYGHGYGGGIIRDECHALPQPRVCSVLVDRRTSIRRRMFNAQPSERAQLREEERDITARLNQDCDIR